MKRLFFVNIHVFGEMNKFIFSENSPFGTFFTGDYNTGRANVVAISPQVISFAFDDSEDSVKCIESIANRAVECGMFFEKIERLAQASDSAQ